MIELEATSEVATTVPLSLMPTDPVGDGVANLPRVRQTRRLARELTNDFTIKLCLSGRLNPLAWLKFATEAAAEIDALADLLKTRCPVVIETEAIPGAETRARNLLRYA